MFYCAAVPPLQQCPPRGASTSRCGCGLVPHLPQQKRSPLQLGDSLLSGHTQAIIMGRSSRSSQAGLIPLLFWAATSHQVPALIGAPGVLVTPPGPQCHTPHCAILHRSSPPPSSQQPAVVGTLFGVLSPNPLLLRLLLHCAHFLGRYAATTTILQHWMKNVFNMKAGN